MQNQRKYKKRSFKTRKSDVEKKEILTLQQSLQQHQETLGSDPVYIQQKVSVETSLDKQDKKHQQSKIEYNKFEQLPISKATIDGLLSNNYKRLTAIQKAAVLPGLLGRDILGAAKTGSGKTLAFLIPLVECLFRKQWQTLDGLGALVISPTRELALQIFEELRKIGKLHAFSAGLLIGGKNVNDEKSRVNDMNILVCTPGRLLQHMDETPNFQCDNLQILVLDEADRILDMGFSQTLNAILENLPKSRQTLLYSATQSNQIKHLARLNLQNPQYINVHEASLRPTPLKLQQAYMVCEAENKLNVLWSFIKTHLKSKMIVFLSTCKQVRFVFETFKHLRPGIPLLSLHGGVKQYKRVLIYNKFVESSQTVLFATDIAARGLDFQNVEWVVQVDCPENVDAYIHRVGRTARYVSGGRALIFLEPHQADPFIKQLDEKKIQLKQTKYNPEKISSITSSLQSLLSKYQELKDFGQRAFVSYVRSIYLQPNKKVFDVQRINFEDLAYSLGLPITPNIKYVNKQPVNRSQDEKALSQIKSQKRAERKRREQELAQVNISQEQVESQVFQQQDFTQNGISVDPQERDKALQHNHLHSNLTSKSQSQLRDVKQDQQKNDNHILVKSEKADVNGLNLSLNVVGKNVLDNEQELAQQEQEQDFLQLKPDLDFDFSSLPNIQDQRQQDFSLPSKIKKKKFKIKQNEIPRNKITFDQEGGVVDPLELFSMQKNNREHKSKSQDDSLQIQNEDIQNRFAAIQRALKSRNILDKKAYKELQKEKKLIKKLKKRQNDDEEQGQAQVVLGGDQDSVSQEPDQREIHDESQGEYNQDSQSQEIQNDDIQSQNKQQKFSQPQFKRKQEVKDQKLISKNKKQKLEDMSINEQEKLALEILQSR